MTRQQQAKFWWLVAIAVTIWLLWMTMRPDSVVSRELWPIIAAARILKIPLYLVVDLAGNIIVFMPLGAALALAMKSRKWAIRILFATLLGAFLSICVELLQMSIPSRYATVEDCLLNTIGAALGATTAYLVRAIVIVIGRRRSTNKAMD
jgi:glycopeptide antibiotics resistance protein